MKAYKMLSCFLLIAASYTSAQFTNTAITTNTYDQSEPTIAVSPLNSNNVIAAWNDFRVINGNDFSKPGYAFSTNGGQTWSEAIVTPSGYTNGFDPSVSFDRFGNAFYCYVASTGSLGPIYVSRTTDFGANWNSHKQVSTLTTDQDKPFMAVDNTSGTYDGRIYVSWSDFSSGSSIKFAYSTNNGTTFSTPQSLGSYVTGVDPSIYVSPAGSAPQFNPTGNFVHGSIPAVGPNGELYVVWADFLFSLGGYNNASFQIRKSTNGGVSFGSPVTAAQFTAKNYDIGSTLDIRTYLPSIAADPVTGYIYLVYADQVSQTDTNLRTKFVRSTDGGSTWSNPTVIADFSIGWQFLPWVTADKNGRVSVLLIHSSDLTNVDFYVTESYNYGTNFSSPLRVSSQSSNPSNASWTHHYHGIANVTGGNNYCIWTDYRNTNADPYFSLANTLYYYATQGKSVSQTATAKNGQRKLVQDGSGNYHNVFSSGGEIFYRKNISGTWQNPVKISYVNGSNDYPSIVLGPSAAVMIVWQRNTSSGYYDIYFSMSTDGGSTWSSTYRYTLATSVSSSVDPSPIIMMNQNSYNKTVLYSSSSGLIAKWSTSYYPTQGNWTSQNVTTSSNDQNPTLASNGGSTYLLQANQNTSDNHVYYRYQDNYGNWGSATNLSSIVPGTAVHQTPSITGIPSSNEIHAAWKMLTNGGSSTYDHKIIHRRNSTANGTWPNEYANTYYEGQQLPSITGLATNKVDLIFQTIPSIANSVYKMRFNGTYWNSPTLVASNSVYPSVSIGSTTSKYVYTNGTSSPYTVTLSSETLSKETTFAQDYYSRSLAIMNNSEEYLEVVLNKMYFKMKDGSKQIIDFESVSLDTFKLSTENAFNLMRSAKELTIPVGADELVFDYKIRGENIEKVIEGNQSNINLAFDLDVPSKSIKRNKQNSIDVLNGTIKETKQEIVIPLSALNLERGYDKIKVGMKLNGLIAKKTAFASLGHIFDFSGVLDNKNLPKEQVTKTSSEIPTNFVLQNYPNPFNPTTKISFSIPQKSQLKLKVFDVLGREVANLADGVYEVGKYEVTFDASKLSSGIYFYNLTTGSNSISKKMLLVK
jgi:hypothetical protein